MIIKYSGTANVPVMLLLNVYVLVKDGADPSEFVLLDAEPAKIGSVVAVSDVLVEDALDETLRSIFTGSPAASSDSKLSDEPWNLGDLPELVKGHLDIDASSSYEWDVVWTGAVEEL